jgi:hypothetical protein
LAGKTKVQQRTARRNRITTLKQEGWACGDISENGKSNDQNMWIRIIKRNIDTETQNM